MDKWLRIYQDYAGDTYVKVVRNWKPRTHLVTGASAARVLDLANSDEFNVYAFKDNNIEGIGLEVHPNG